MDTIIHLDRVTLRSGYRRLLLRDASLKVSRGERVKLAGARSGGREGVMRLIGGLCRPEHGEVSVLGIPVHTLDDDEAAAFRREHIGCASNEPGFCPALSVLENVTLPLMLLGKTGAEREQRGVQLLKSIGLAHILYAFPSAVSEAEMRAAALVRAFIAKPEIILLDDIYDGLEDEADRLTDVLESLCTGGETLLLFTEKEGEGIRVDRKLFVESGTIRG